MHGIEEELGRPVYGLADYFFRDAARGRARCGPGSAVCRPTPTTPAGSSTTRASSPSSSPRGPRAPSKTYTDRYRLRRFGRGGFVEIAMRAGVPVIPIAVVGAEESMPILFRVPGAGQAPRACRTSRSPPTCCCSGPSGSSLYFPAKFKLRVLDPVTFDVPSRLRSATRRAG